MPFKAKNIATVFSLFVLSNGSIYHYFGGIIPLQAKQCATVQP